MGDTILDILKFFDNYQKNINEQDEDFSDDQYYIHMDMDGSFWDDGGHMFTWDLSKIYLSEQSDDVKKSINQYLTK